MPQTQLTAERPATSTRFLLFILLLLTVGFRIVRLDADPPADFDWSGGYFADEGFWAHNARNARLFGPPVSDEWDARIVSPLFAGLQYWMFQLFGVGLIQVRLIAILSSVCIVVCCFLFFRRQFDDRSSFLLAMIVSLNFPMLVLGRQGILDPFAAALACCSFALLFARRSLAVFLAGVLLTAACVTKYLMIYTLAPICFALSFQTRKAIAAFLAGFTISAVLWLMVVYLPNTTLLSSYNSYYASQQSWDVRSVLKNIIQQPFYLYFLKTPVILFLANLTLWYFLADFKTTGKIEKICLVWLLSGIVFFAIWKYRPLRYYTPLIPALAGLAGAGILRLDQIRRALQTHRTRWLIWTGVLVPFAQSAFVLADLSFGWNFIPKEVGLHSINAIIFLVLTILFLIPQFRWMPVAIAVAFLFTDIREYTNWMARPGYAAAEISRDLQTKVGSGAVTGQWAPELSLENSMRVVPVWKGFVNSNDPFNKYNITHVLQWEYSLGGEKFGEWYPLAFRDFVPVAHYRIKDSDVVLYERQTSK